MSPVIETCCHVPTAEYCLVGVIGEDRPHCARCEVCGEMIEFERYDTAGQERIRSMYRDTVLSGPEVAPVESPALDPYGRMTFVGARRIVLDQTGQRFGQASRAQIIDTW